MNKVHEIIINLGGEEEGYEGIWKVMDILLSEKKGKEEKIRVLEEATGVKLNEKMKGEIEKMCNLSEGVMKRGMTEGLQKGIEKGILIGEERMREKAKKEKLTIFSK